MIYFSIFPFVGLMVWPVIYLHPDQDGKLLFMMLSAKWWLYCPCVLQNMLNHVSYMYPKMILVYIPEQ